MIPKNLATNKQKHKEQTSDEKETKGEQRLKKRELRKQSSRQKDGSTGADKVFSAALLQINLKIKYMEGDGNCLFRSIADQLTGECSNVSYCLTSNISEAKQCMRPNSAIGAIKFLDILQILLIRYLRAASQHPKTGRGIYRESKRPLHSLHGGRRNI